MSRIYVDTNIYIDYCRGRTSRTKPFNEFAFQLYKRAIDCEFIILISRPLFIELSKELRQNEIAQTFSPLKERNKLEWISATAEDHLFAKKIGIERAIPWQDALHAVLAKKGQAECVVTRDRHFESLIDLIESKPPESL